MQYCWVFQLRLLILHTSQLCFYQANLFSGESSPDNMTGSLPSAGVQSLLPFPSPHPSISSTISEASFTLANKSMKASTSMAMASLRIEIPRSKTMLPNSIAFEPLVHVKRSSSCIDIINQDNQIRQDESNEENNKLPVFENPSTDPICLSVPMELSTSISVPMISTPSLLLQILTSSKTHDDLTKLSKKSSKINAESTELSLNGVGSTSSLPFLATEILPKSPTYCKYYEVRASSNKLSSMSDESNLQNCISSDNTTELNPKEKNNTKNGNSQTAKRYQVQVTYV